MTILFKPVGILSGILAGIIARKVFEKGWGAIAGEEPPDAEHREIQIRQLALALIFEGAIFALVRGLVDHGARVGFARYTGVWPGEEKPEAE